MTKILVTGAGGYIGSVATSLFLDHGFQVVAVDNLSHGFKQPHEFLAKKHGKDKLKFYKKNLEDIAKVLDKEEGVEAVIHYGAFCSVNESVEDPIKYFINNTYGTTRLLKALLERNIKKIVFSSTCAVYGEAKYLPVDEAHPTNPSNPYGLSKRMIEQELEWLDRSKEFKSVILRYFNICGALDDGSIGDSKKPSVHLMQNAVRGALGLEEFSLTYSEVDTPDKSPIRDYVDVVDLARAHLKALEYLLKGGESQIINLGSGEGNSVLEIIKKVEELTAHKFELKKAKPRAGEYGKMVANNKKAKKVLNWTPEKSLEDSVNSLIKWYKLHPKGWKY